MPWAKLDDSIWRNEKLLEVTPAARWLYVAAIAFCRSEETAGEITRKRMTFLVGGQGLKASHVAELVKAGLFDDIDYGYAVHDYEHFNPLTSTERVRKHRRNAPAPVTETQAETPGARSPRAGAGVHRVSQFPEPVSRGDLSPIATSGTNQPESRPPWPEEELCIWFESFIGRMLSADEVTEAADWIREFQYMDLERYRARIEGTAKAREAESKPPHRTLMDYRHSVQLENTHRANSGLQKIGYQATGRNARMVTA